MLKKCKNFGNLELLEKINKILLLILCKKKILFLTI